MFNVVHSEIVLHNTPLGFKLAIELGSREWRDDRKTRQVNFSFEAKVNGTLEHVGAVLVCTEGKASHDHNTSAMKLIHKRLVFFHVVYAFVDTLLCFLIDRLKANKNTFASAFLEYIKQFFVVTNSGSGQAHPPLFEGNHCRK